MNTSVAFLIIHHCQEDRFQPRLTNSSFCSSTITQCVCNGVIAIQVPATTQAPTAMPITDTPDKNNTDGDVVDLFPGAPPDACVDYDDATMLTHARLPSEFFTACHHSSDCGEDAGYDGTYCCGSTSFCMCLQWNTTDEKKSFCVWP
jgi:hypothetical protein